MHLGLLDVNTDFRRARTVAPILHAVLFCTASVLHLISDKPILNRPAHVPIVSPWVADIPISMAGFAVMFFSDKYGWLAWGLWGIIGTVWWYFLGLSIEAWVRRFL